jgi:hypothetical protein
VVNVVVELTKVTTVVTEVVTTWAGLVGEVACSAWKAVIATTTLRATINAEKMVVLIRATRSLNV